jgi:hypothetical protein
MKKAFLILSSIMINVFCTYGQKPNKLYEEYDKFYMSHSDSMGRVMHVLDIPFDTTIYNPGTGDAMIDLNGDGKIDAIGRMTTKLLPSDYKKLSQYKTDTLNQLCIYLNEGDSILRYKTKSPFVLSGDYLPWYTITKIDNKSFMITTEGRQQDRNYYYLFFQYDKITDHFYLIRSLVQTASDNNNSKNKIEEKVYDLQTRIPFEKVNFTDYFKYILDKVPQRENWGYIKADKVYIYDMNFQLTKMYLIKHDCVRIDAGTSSFYKITYFVNNSNRRIEGWIKKSDVE